MTLTHTFTQKTHSHNHKHTHTPQKHVARKTMSPTHAEEKNAKVRFKKTVINKSILYISLYYNQRAKDITE